MLSSSLHAVILTHIITSTTISSPASEALLCRKQYFNDDTSGHCQKNSSKHALTPPEDPKLAHNVENVVMHVSVSPSMPFAFPTAEPPS
jgi:hypothetical protein